MSEAPLTGQQLQDFRTQVLKLTREQICQRLKVPLGTYSKWEREERRMPPYIDALLDSLILHNHADEIPEWLAKELGMPTPKNPRRY